MGVYGVGAIQARNMIITQNIPPRQAWNAVWNGGQKSCSRVAFLGLCENGLVAGVRKGNYIQGQNSIIKIKAINIRNIIMSMQPSAIPPKTKTQTWRQAGGSGRDQGVIDVVYSLFIAGYLL